MALNYYFLSVVFTVIIMFNYLSFYSQKSAIQTVNDMGIGYNLGKTFNIFENLDNNTITNNTLNYQLKMWGIILPTKAIINKIKKSGFKTIRLGVISTNSSDESGKVSSEWILGIKEVIDWVINYNMYCILSVYYDGNFWRKKSNRNKYINFWTQIAQEFMNIDEHLIFESMNEEYYGFLFESNDYQEKDYYYDFESYKNNILNSTQDFIYIIRNSGGFNTQRLLVIPGLVTDYEISFYSFFFEPEVPKDPVNKIAVSLNYYFPSQMYVSGNISPMIWYNKYGFIYETISMTDWDSILDYKQMVKNFDFLRKYYINNGIPVIIGEVGIITEKNKDLISLREFLYVIFAISSEFNGVMCCLWDISEKIESDLNYYNKESNIWRDETIKNNFLKISKGKYVNSSNYYHFTNIEFENSPLYNTLDIDIGTKKALEITLYAKLSGELHIDYEYGIFCADKSGKWNDIITDENGIKQYDGTLAILIDVRNIECYDHIEAVLYWGSVDDALKNLTVEYEEYYNYFDYKSYRDAVINEFNKNTLF